MLEKCLYTYGYYHIVDSDIRYCTLHVCLNFSLRQRVPIIDGLQNNLLEYLSPFYTLKINSSYNSLCSRLNVLPLGWQYNYSLLHLVSSIRTIDWILMP